MLKNRKIRSLLKRSVELEKKFRKENGQDQYMGLAELKDTDSSRHLISDTRKANQSLMSD